MSTRPDHERSIVEWLVAEAPDRAPERLLEASRKRIRSTRQRRAWWPAWRVPEMNNTVRLIAVAAVLVVSVLIGYQLLIAPNVGGPGPAPSPTESPSLVPASSAAPSAPAFPAAGTLAVGQHPMTLVGVPLSMEITTTGWTSNGQWGIEKGDVGTAESADFLFWPDSAPDTTFADPCTDTPLDPRPEGSATGLATAVSTIPGTDLVSGPSAVTVDGSPAQHVVITVREDIGCAPNQFYLWWDVDTLEAIRYATEPGSTIYVWIIEKDGAIVWIEAETFVGSSPELASEIEQIVNSIQFE